MPLRLAQTAVGHVLAYAVDTGDGIVLVDTGWRGSATEQELSGMLDRGPNIGLGDLAGVVVTHHHADHCGLAATLRAKYHLPVSMHRLEQAPLRARSAPDDAHLESSTEQWLRQLGVPPADRPVYLRIAVQLATLGERVDVDQSLNDGMRLGRGAWRLIVEHRPGHTPGHVCLRSPGRSVVFAGDLLLPHISASLMLLPEDDSDPVQAYLDSIAQVQVQWSGTLVLPGHGYPFTNVAQRAEAVIGRMRSQLRSTHDVVAQGRQTPWQIAQTIPWSGGWARRSDRSRRAALAQTHAYLRHLERVGVIACVAQSPLRYRATSAVAPIPDARTDREVRK